MEVNSSAMDVDFECPAVTNGLIKLQKLEEKAAKAQEAFEKEEKLRKELEVLNSKLLAEKTELLSSLEGEKGSLSEFQEKTAKLTAQKNDLDNQLRVSKIILRILSIIPVSRNWYRNQIYTNSKI